MKHRTIAVKVGRASLRHVARAVVALSLLAPALAPAVAHADEVSPEMEQRRTQLFKEGRALAASGKWSEAAAKFRAVVEIRTAPKALIALALAEQHQGHFVEAKRLCEKARFDAREAQNKDDEDAAVAALRDLEGHVPSIALHLPADVRGVSVTIDGRPAELKGGEVDVDPGDRSIVVSAPGRVDFQASVKAEEGKRSELDVALPVPSAAKSGADAGHITMPPLGVFILGGVGLGASVAGVVLLANGKEGERDVAKVCSDLPKCSPEVQANADAADKKILAGGLLIGVGAASLAGGAVWWILSAKKPAAPATAAAPPRVMIAPLRAGAWVTLEGSF